MLESQLLEHLLHPNPAIVVLTGAAETIDKKLKSYLTKYPVELLDAEIPALDSAFRTIVITNAHNILEHFELFTMAQALKEDGHKVVVTGEPLDDCGAPNPAIAVVAVIADYVENLG